MDDWVDAEYECPVIEKGYLNVSIDVLAMDNVGQTFKAYYDYTHNVWRYTCDSRIVKKNIVRWQSL